MACKKRVQTLKKRWEQKCHEVEAVLEGLSAQRNAAAKRARENAEVELCLATGMRNALDIVCKNSCHSACALVSAAQSLLADAQEAKSVECGGGSSGP